MYLSLPFTGIPHRTRRINWKYSFVASNGALLSSAIDHLSVSGRLGARPDAGLWRINSLNCIVRVMSDMPAMAPRAVTGKTWASGTVTNSRSWFQGFCRSAAHVQCSACSAWQHKILTYPGDELTIEHCPCLCKCQCHRRRSGCVRQNQCLTASAKDCYITG